MKYDKNKLLICGGILLVIATIFLNINFNKIVGEKFLKTLYTSNSSRYEQLLQNDKFDESKPKQIQIQDLSVYTNIYKKYATENCMNKMRKTYWNLFLLTDKFAYETNSKVIVDKIELRLDDETDLDKIYTYTVYFTNIRGKKQKQHATIGEIYVSKRKLKVVHIKLYDQLCFDYIKQHLD